MKITHAFYINMPGSHLRNSQFREEMKNTDIKIERLDGIDGKEYLKPGDPPLTRGIIGSMLASKRAIHLAFQMNYDNIMIFDDDAQLCDDFDNKLQAAIDELPDDWAILRLHPTTTGNPLIEPFSDKLNRAYGGNGSYGYIVNSKYYQYILEAIEDNYRKPSSVDIGHIKTFDVILAELMNEIPFYQVKETLVYHRDGFSDRMGINMRFGLGKPGKMKIKVRYTDHIYYHAQKLGQILNDLGYECMLTKEVNHREDDTLYILYTAFQVPYRPKNYIVYQCEQWNSHWMNAHYQGIMDDALAVWEWSEDNMSKHKPNIKEKLSHVPPGLINVPSEIKNLPKIYDVLFYGWLNERRARIINSMRSKFNIKVETNLFGIEMLKMIAQSKVVLNLHFHPHATLEMFRVNESLCAGANIVTEAFIYNQERYPSKYHGLIELTPEFNISNTLTSALHKTEIKNLSSLDNTSFIKAAIEKIKI